MAARQLWIEYRIYPADAATATALQAQYPNGIQMAPAAAAILFGAPIVVGGGAEPPPPRINLPPMSATSVISTSVLTYNKSNDIHASGGAFVGTVFDAYWALRVYGPSTTADDTSAAVTWVGYFLWEGSAPAVPPGGPLQSRRFMCGFELPLLGEGGSAQGQFCSRSASRTSDGFGFAFRNNASCNRLEPIPAPLQQFRSWERLYIRPRTYSTGGLDDVFWTWNGTFGGTTQCRIDSSGFLKIYNNGVVLVTSSFPLAIGTWYRLDLLLDYPIVFGNPGHANIYINGVLDMLGFAGSVGGLGQFGSLHVSSMVGSASANGAEYDLDDWVNCTSSGVAGTGLDWLNGSHIQVVRATGFGAGHSVNWTGDWRTLQPNPLPTENAGNVLTNALTSGAIVITTDYQDRQIGCASINVSFFELTGGAVTGQLGYQANGVPNLASTVVANSTWSTALFHAGGQAKPALLFPLTLEWIPVSASTVQALQATAEFLGAWGPEDNPPIPVLPHYSGLHNAPYPDSGAGGAVTAPYAVVGVHAGVYTGNDLGQDVLSVLPAHWWWVRSVSAPTTGVAWWSSLEAAHSHTAASTTPDRVSRANEGPTPSIGVAGPAPQSNANTTTYQWIAFSDPGMRFLLNDAFAHLPGLASAVNPTKLPSFAPDGVFFFKEDLQASAASAHWFKGPGHTTDRASLLTAADQAGVATFAAGTITSKSPIHTDAPQTGYAAWRKSDGTYSGIIDIFTYTGNGSGSNRSLAAALGGGSPLMTIVVPHNGQSWTRDPSHVGLHSTAIDNTDSTTAIVGGDINTIIVGPTLNTNLIVYDVFVIAGTANPGGWSGNPSAPIFNVLPVMRAPDTLWPPDPTPTPPPSPTSGCVSLSQALTEIGVRLGDPTWVHWTLPEVQRYLFEALRTWNALAQFYRDQGAFNVSSPNAFYDLPTVLPTLRGYTLKDQDLVLDIEYALLEPPSATTWTGTAQFTLAQLTQAINRRRDLFLRETGIVLLKEQTAIVSVASGRLTMSKDIIEIRRAAWITGGGVVVPLKREDEWALAMYRRAWQTAADPANVWPLAYSTAVEFPFVMQLAPPPNNNGTIETIAVVVGAVLNPATGVLLGIPDDWAWVVKFGALADLLSMPGPNTDPTRAGYCEGRWQQGVKMAAKASVVLNAWIGGVQSRIASVVDADKYQRSWQTTPGAPQMVLTMGQNLVAVSPPPDVSGPYSVTLDVVRKAPVPVLLTDCFFEGGVSVLEAIYNYACHLALFKEGPGQLSAAMELLNMFFREAGITIEIDLATTPNRDPLMGQTNQDERVLPRIGPPGLSGSDVAGTEPRN